MSAIVTKTWLRNERHPETNKIVGVYEVWVGFVCCGEQYGEPKF